MKVTVVVKASHFTEVASGVTEFTTLGGAREAGADVPWLLRRSSDGFATHCAVIGRKVFVEGIQGLMDGRWTVLMKVWGECLMRL